MFKRGFKSQCERRSVQFRKDLGIDEKSPLDAKTLAKQLGITVWSTDDVARLPAEVREILCDPTDNSWSALALRIETHHLVIYKPVPSTGRVNSVIMHELSHIILGHKLAGANILNDGSLAPANYDQDQENEADWLAGTLLLPRQALLQIRQRKMSDEDATGHFKVSQQMLTWRFRMTGVDYQINRKRRRA